MTFILPAPTKLFKKKSLRLRSGQAKKNICKVCGADMDVWREVFNEEHHCP